MLVYVKVYGMKGKKTMRLDKNGGKFKSRTELSRNSKIGIAQRKAFNLACPIH